MPDYQPIILAVDDLNDAVMASASDKLPTFAPEDSPASTLVTVWDQAPGSTGHEVKPEPPDDSEGIALQLVEAGNEEADRERRDAAEPPPNA